MEIRLVTPVRGSALMGLLLASALGGCASMACRPSVIVVAKKDERVRLETPLGWHQTESGRIEEAPMTTVREYWVQAEDGGWYRVSIQQFDAVAPGDRLEVCR
jgi:hypothetical protein